MSSDDPIDNKLETPMESPRPRFRGRFREAKVAEDGRYIWIEWQDGFRVAFSASWLRLQAERWIKR